MALSGPTVQDVDRGVVVPIQGRAASAPDPAVRESQMLEEDSAARARPAREGWFDLDHLATGTLSLVRKTGDKERPARVQYALSQAGTGHGMDPQVFKHDQIESLDRLSDETC